MKHFAFIILLNLFFTLTGHSQQGDTLKVLVLSPYKITVCKECQQEYRTRNELFVKNRKAAADTKRKEKLANLEQYNQQPEYTKRMFENDLSFIDSLNLRNYIAYVTREFVAYRLYKPYKIKPRLVFITTQKLPSNADNYTTKALQAKVDFIINFPLISVERINKELRVNTSTELYSSKQKAVILKGVSTGTIAGEGTTDYPMCEPGQLDCAFVNSVYENINKCIIAIAESHK